MVRETSRREELAQAAHTLVIPGDPNADIEMRSAGGLLLAKIENTRMRVQAVRPPPAAQIADLTGDLRLRERLACEVARCAARWWSGG